MEKILEFSFAIHRFDLQKKVDIIPLMATLCKKQKVNYAFQFCLSEPDLRQPFLEILHKQNQHEKLQKYCAFFKMDYQELQASQEKLKKEQEWKQIRFLFKSKPWEFSEDFFKNNPVKLQYAFEVENLLNFWFTINKKMWLTPLINAH